MTNPRQGVVLVAVLWLIALLSAVAMAAAVSFRGFAGVVALDRDRVRAEALFTAGIESAAQAIAMLGDTPLDMLDIKVDLLSGSVRAVLSDEGGRIDVGKAPVEVLTALFRYIGAPETEADSAARSIDEWRNRGEKSPAAGASKVPAQIASAGPPFSEVRQLLQVPGILPHWIVAIAPLTTTYGRETINPLTAPPEVLAALPGVDRSRIGPFLQMRAKLRTDVSQVGAMLGTQQRFLEINPRPIVRVDLTATIADDFTDHAQAVIVQMPGDREPYRVLAWNPLASRSRE
jgi:general secretion pathway protein K